MPPKPNSLSLSFPRFPDQRQLACKQKLKPVRWDFYLIKTNLFRISRGKEIIAVLSSSFVAIFLLLRMDIKSKKKSQKAILHHI